MSRKMKHTSGPWRRVGRYIDAHKSGHEDGICQILFTGDPDVDAQVEADACLITAAPDLLEALQAAVDCGMVPQSTAEDGACRHIRAVQVADMIRAAIAKAEG